jgi:hypothetical protein
MRTLLKPTGETKPEKPYEDFPLFAHATGRWAKKIRGKLHYFGSWDNPNAALEKYLNERDDLYAGRKPRTSPEGITVKDLLNRFLTAKTHLLETGEIVQRTFADYKQTCIRIAQVIDRTRLLDDLDSQDFEKLREKIAKTRGPVAPGKRSATGARRVQVRLRRGAC